MTRMDVDVRDFILWTYWTFRRKLEAESGGEIPGISYEELGAIVGLSKGRVSQIFTAMDPHCWRDISTRPRDEMWDGTVGNNHFFNDVWVGLLYRELLGRALTDTDRGVSALRILLE